MIDIVYATDAVIMAALLLTEVLQDMSIATMSDTPRQRYVQWK